MDQQVDEFWRELQEPIAKPREEKLTGEFRKVDEKLQKNFSKFYYKQKSHRRDVACCGEHSREISDIASHHS